MKARAKPLLIAFGMAAALAVAVPVQAQPSTAFGLQFGFGAPERSAPEITPRIAPAPDAPVSRSPGPSTDRSPDTADEVTAPAIAPPDFMIEAAPAELCLTPEDIDAALTARGYADIVLETIEGPLVDVSATLDGTTYLLRYDPCTDEIVEDFVLP